MPRDLMNDPRIIKLIGDIDITIEYWKQKLGKDYKVSEKIKWFEQFKDRVISGDSAAIFEDQFASLKNELIESSKKSKKMKSEEKLSNIQKRWEISKILNDHRKNKPKRLYETEEKIQARIQELKRRYINFEQDTLAEEVAKLVFALEVRHQDIETLTEERDFLAEQLEENISARRSTVKNQNTNKNALYAKNKAPLLECIKVIESRYQDFPRKFHYRKFCELVTELHPIKPFQQAGSLFGEEKLQSKEIQEINRKANKNSKWSTTTLRNFFEAYIGRKITSLEK